MSTCGNSNHMWPRSEAAKNMSKTMNVNVLAPLCGFTLFSLTFLKPLNMCHPAQPLIFISNTFYWAVYYSILLLVFISFS